MKKITLVSIVLSLVISTYSCSKHRGDVAENIPVATIQFSRPTNDAVYNPADSINIQAIAISTASIHGYDLAIKSAHDTTPYFFQHVHEHNDTLVINKKWKGDAVTSTELEAWITLYLDHEGHTKTGTAAFKIQ